MKVAGYQFCCPGTPCHGGANCEVPRAQQNDHRSLARDSDCCATAANLRPFNQLPIATGWHIVPRPMTASDLGIVDQNLDDKVGMEA